MGTYRNRSTKPDVQNYHKFHIPVMGTGHSADTPIRVAPFGISSVISFVDDLLLEKLREYYNNFYGLPYERIKPSTFDGRSKRITAYLETVQEVVRIRMDEIKALPFGEDNDKAKYFELLPNDCPLRKDYDRLLGMPLGKDRDLLADNLTERMRPGSIDVNIMVKLDRRNFDSDGNELEDIYSDAKAAIRGYALSSLKSSVVFSAGINQTLFTYLTQFPDFYPDENGETKKKIIIKVSDFRSAMIQGKFLARKGLRVHEFRVESGINCGGHAFPANGNLLISGLQEFREKRHQFAETLPTLIEKYYEKNGLPYNESMAGHAPLISVQGGIGTHGEMCRLFQDYDVDMAGWCSPFLFVPEATCVDQSTMDLLRDATAEDFYQSDVSPLGVPFNNLRKTGSELWTSKRVDEQKPGSPCPKGFLAANTEFTDIPICVASRHYQKKKIEQINAQVDLTEEEKDQLCAQVVEKSCICDHLGNGVLIALGIATEDESPQSICPGPNAAWFDRFYSLKEMVDHIYGRRESLVPKERPHVFVRELVLYIDHIEKQLNAGKMLMEEPDSMQIRDALFQAMDLCMELSSKTPIHDENLASIPEIVEQQKVRLKTLFSA